MITVVIRKLSLLLILILCHGCSSNSDKAINGQLKNANSISKLQSELIFEKSKIFPNNTQVSIAIIENGVVRYYGIKKENHSILTFDNHDKVFEIGSISKVFTSTLLADLVLNNKVQLTSAINDHLDFSLKDDSIITFEHLANHTSGLPRLPTNLQIEDNANPYKSYGERKLVEYLTKELRIKPKPAREHEYSNLGVGLLGYTLSQVESSNYEDLLQTKIFHKYQMTSSTTDRNRVTESLVKGRNELGRETPNWDFSTMVGAGGILSTVEDLAKFANAQFDESNKDLALTRKKTIILDTKVYSAKGTSIGLGWFIVDTEVAKDVYFHNGGTGGYSSSLLVDPANKNAVIILSNVSAYNENSPNITELSFELMDTLESN